MNYKLESTSRYDGSATTTYQVASSWGMTSSEAGGLISGFTITTSGNPV